MPENKRVRIIKRKERKGESEVEQEPERKEKTAQEVTRALKETVAEWVNEHRLKQERESNRSFDQLFAEAA